MFNTSAATFAATAAMPTAAAATSVSAIAAAAAAAAAAIATTVTITTTYYYVLTLFLSSFSFFSLPYLSGDIIIEHSGLPNKIKLTPKPNFRKFEVKTRQKNKCRLICSTFRPK